MMKVPTGPYSGLLSKMTLVPGYGCFKRELSGTHAETPFFDVSRHISPAATEGKRPDEPESDMPRAYLAERIQMTRVAGANYLLGTPPHEAAGRFRMVLSAVPCFQLYSGILLRKSPQPQAETWDRRMGEEMSIPLHQFVGELTLG